MKNLTLVKEFGHSGQRKWDFYLRFLLYVMVVFDMPQIEALWVQPFEPPFFFFDTSWEILTSQNRKGNSQCFLYAFSDWRHPKRESVNSGTTFRDRHAKVLLPPRNLLSTTFVNRSKNEKWLKNDRNFHLKIEPKIGMEKPIDFLLFCWFCRTSPARVKIHPPVFQLFHKNGVFEKSDHV